MPPTTTSSGIRRNYRISSGWALGIMGVWPGRKCLPSAKPTPRSPSLSKINLKFNSIVVVCSLSGLRSVQGGTWLALGTIIGLVLSCVSLFLGPSGAGGTWLVPSLFSFPGSKDSLYLFQIK
jgi:hypothetical protein